MEVYLVLDKYENNSELIGICTSREKAEKMKQEFIVWLYNEEGYSLDDDDVSIVYIPALDEVVAPYTVSVPENL